MAVQTLWTKTGKAGSVSGGDYPDLVAEPSPFEAASRWAGGELVVQTEGAAEFAGAYGVDADFLTVFKETPEAGRLISAEEFKTKANVAVVSHGFATRHYGDPEHALGRAVRIEERALTVVGVLRAGFHFPEKADVWLPMFWENLSRTAHNYRAIARLRPGVSVESARAGLAAVGARLQSAFPASHKDKSFTATALKDVLVERSRSTLWLLLAAAGLVLLVACANVANLLLARATGRAREMALRAALGAGRSALLRQLLVESAVLGIAGGAVGLALAYVGLDALLSLAPANLPRLSEVRLDSAVLAFNLAVSLISGALFGLWPAWRAFPADVYETLKQGECRAVLGGGRGHGARAVLVVSELSLALVLALGAGLLFRSFLALNAVDLGYRTDRRLVVTASIPAQTDKQYLEAGAEFERIFDAIRTVPGVLNVAAVMGLPSGPYGSNGYYAVEGRHTDFSRLDQMPQAGFRLTSPGYFEAIGTPLLSGRDFATQDLYEAEPVAIVSATLARQVFPGENPLGKRLKCGLDRDVWMRIVGVVGDMRNDSPAIAPLPEIYMAYRQHPYHANELHIVVRTGGDPSSYVRPVRTAILAVNSGIPLKLAPLDQFHSDAVALPRFRTLLFTVFAIVAGMLAMAGVYGVMSYVAAGRRAEMGLRIALGARGRDVVGLLMKNGVTLAAIGLAVGLGLAFALSRFLASLLFGIRPNDPVTLAGAILLLGATALAAVFIPAVRIAVLDPAMILRDE